MSASTNLKEPPATLSGVRSALAVGDIVKARDGFDKLTTPPKSNADVWLVEARLLEAEGNPEAALSRLEEVLKAFPTSPQAVLSANLHIARLGMLANAPVKAEAAARAVLLVDPSNLTALRALEFVHLQRGEQESRLQVLRQIALSQGASEMDLWRAVSVLSDAGLWMEVLAIIDQREFDLDPWRLTPVRLRALIGLDWRERALAHLLKAYADGYIRPNDAINLLIESGALAIAASFVAQALAEDPWQRRAGEKVRGAIEHALSSGSLVDAPTEYVDAMHARELLLSLDGADSGELVTARAHLLNEARRLFENDDSHSAARLLTAASRIPPVEHSTMMLLAEAARRAGLKERYLDTLMRIWREHHDSDALIATASGVLDTSSWPLIAEVMAVAISEAAELGIDVDAVVQSFRVQACRRLEECIGSGDVGGGLELVTALNAQFPLPEWPADLIARLLRAAKRRIRAQKAGADAVVASLSALYLQIDPADPDVSRLLARVFIRQRRGEEARELLSRALRMNPHVPGDWVALAMAHHELGNLNERAYCTARALIMSPNLTLPAPLAQVRAGIEA
jgi:tetratricopeptide (TPR) repeat protein